MNVIGSISKLILDELFREGFEKEIQEVSEGIVKETEGHEDLFPGNVSGITEALEEAGEGHSLPELIKAIRLSGKYPYYTELITAAAMLVSGNEEHAEEVTGLRFADVAYCIREFITMLKSEAPFREKKLVDFIKEAYEDGFYSEITYRGCGQCTIAGLNMLLKEDNHELFQAATGFSGGMALCGDGACGGYAGGILMLGLKRGRGFERMLKDKDKENQYACYFASQELHDRFVACFGSPICREIHKAMFDGKSYLLREKPNRDAFEAQGAHTEKCTSVVAIATSWTAELMVKYGLVTL
ncbi:MAG: C_GCAxxG_C_C family protein [Clostridia bacterium]|nr:C_GCAxxG_C_C family protein [Clostridia bacterium]